MGLTPPGKRLLLPLVRHGQLDGSIPSELAVYKSGFLYRQNILRCKVPGLPVTLEGWDAEEDALHGGSRPAWRFVPYGTSGFFQSPASLFNC